ncbi:MAG: YcxB family protein [Clostridiales bacterium]|nr:YcxB family protein [Clostridiales bacterium]
MTEPLVRNHTEITLRLFREGARLQLRQKYNRMTAKVALALLAALAVLALLMWFLSGSFSALGMEAVLYVLILGWIRIALPRTECKRAYQAMVSRCGGGAPCRELLFYEDHLLVQPETEEAISIPYEAITAVRETKRTLTLSYTEGATVLLDKAGFLQGGVEDVWALLTGAGKGKASL